MEFFLTIIETIRQNFELFGIVIIFVFILSLFLLVKRTVARDTRLVAEKIRKLKSFYAGEAVFLCNTIEEMGADVLYLYGEPINASVRPGMKIDVNGTECIIKEVNPDFFETGAEYGVSEMVIVINKGSLDWERFEQNVDRDFVIPLRLR